MDEKETASVQQMLDYLIHELRTPLNGVWGMLERMSGKEALKNDEDLENAKIATQYMIEFIEDAFEYARMEKSKIKLKIKAIGQDKIGRYIQGVLQPEAEKKGIKLHVRLSLEPYSYIYIDAEHAGQIVTNLVQNAIRYTKEGGEVWLEVYTEYLDINRVRLVMEVEDNGIGMHPQFLEKAFLPFMREGRVEQRKGIGLGLTIVKKLVEQMNGTIQVESQPEHGTKIRVDMETDAADEFYEKKEKANERKLNAEEAGSLYLEKKRILIAEDDEINMKIITGILKDFGICVDATYDGDEVSDIFLQSEENYYDLIFMDMEMPGKDGIEAAKEIRGYRRKDAQTIPIIAMSGNKPETEKEGIQEAKLNGSVVKPFDRSDIAKILEQYFSKG